MPHYAEVGAPRLVEGGWRRRDAANVEAQRESPPMTALDVVDEVELGLSESRVAAVSNARPFALARAAAEVMRLGSMVVLARLVTPSEFGAATVALTAYTVAYQLSGEGLVNPLVQRRALTRRDLEAGVALSVAMGFATALLSFVIGLLVVRPLMGARVGLLVMMCSPAFLVACLNSVPLALLHRSLSFRRIGVTEVISTVALVVVSIVLAEFGARGASVVEGTIVGALVQTVLQWYLVRDAVPRPRLHRPEARRIVRFGVPSFAAGLGVVGYHNIDYIILSIKMSTLQVGYYWRAFSLAVDYQQKVGLLLLRFALPLYTRARSDVEKRQLRVRIGRLQAALIYPLLTLLIVLAPVLVPWLFGPQWRPSIVPTQILAAAGMLAAFRALAGPFMLTIGQPQALAQFNFPAMAFYGVVVVVTAHLGLLAVCWGALGTEVMLACCAWRFLLHRRGGVPITDVVRELGPPTLASLLAASVCVPLLTALRDAGVPSVGILVGVGAAGTAVYAVAVRVCFPSTWTDLLMVRTRRRA